MARTIKASEVKPGMVVKWDSNGFTHEGSVERVTSGASAYTTRFISGSFGMTVSSDTTVTVLSEPLPEEPSAPGARVMACERRFVRADNDDIAWMDLESFIWRTWEEVCAMGPVTVIDADPYWEVTGNAEPSPEVPDWIEEWPEDDEHLRDYLWLDSEGDTWTWDNIVSRWKCTSPSGKHLISRTNPFCDPWIRITIKEQKEN